MNDPPPPAAPQARGEGALSPLSGSYLLIVVAEPHVEQHKDTILSRISKGKFLLVTVCEGQLAWLAGGGGASWCRAAPNQCRLPREAPLPASWEASADCCCLVHVALILSFITFIFARL